MLVVDAAFVVAALVDGGTDGTWAESFLVGEHLLAPHLMPVEAANVLRRLALSGDLVEDVATVAHSELLSMSVELFPYAPFAERTWQLRSTLTAYDAWYVALAEATGAALATLDRRLARAAGPRCAFLTPP
jgi:predicted nucleic acid-binding protein